MSMPGAMESNGNMRSTRCYSIICFQSLLGNCKEYRRLGKVSGLVVACAGPNFRTIGQIWR